MHHSRPYALIILQLEKPIYLWIIMISSNKLLVTHTPAIIKGKHPQHSIT